MERIHKELIPATDSTNSEMRKICTYSLPPLKVYKGRAIPLCIPLMCYTKTGHKELTFKKSMTKLSIKTDQLCILTTVCDIKPYLWILYSSLPFTLPFGFMYVAPNHDKSNLMTLNI